MDDQIGEEYIIFHGYSLSFGCCRTFYEQIGEGRKELYIVLDT